MTFKKCHSDIQKNVSYRWFFTSLRFTKGKFLKDILTHLHCAKYNEINSSNSNVGSMFRVQDFCYVKVYACKWLKMYF